MLPEHLDTWLTALIGRPLPDEPRSSCLDCPMNPESPCGSRRPAAVASFHPRSKCCTYLPVLHNFLVGRILRDDDPRMAEGAASVRARIEAGVAVTPLGLGWPRWYDRAYDEDRVTHFGRRQELRCPHYLDRDGGLCGVWKHRNAICSTWYCRHTRGEVGRAVWEVVEKAADLMEDGLARWLLAEVGVEPEIIARLTSDLPADTLDGDVPITPELRARAWGHWLGREEAFYLATAEVMDGLGPDDLARIGGARLAARIEEATDALDDHDRTRLPPFLRAADTLREVTRTGGQAWLEGYRPYDLEPVDVRLADALAALPVLPSEAVAAWLAERAGVRVAGPQVRFFVDQGWLVATLPS